LTGFTGLFGFFYYRFPDETGNVQSASRKERCHYQGITFPTISRQILPYEVLFMLMPNFRRQAYPAFTVSTGNHEKILLILLILSKKYY
jgi:hypothetical protein